VERWVCAGGTTRGGVPNFGSSIGVAAPFDHGMEFLWEQIEASVPAVELHEVRRVVGSDLVQSCEDIYAEVRALRDILHDFSATTDALVRESTSKVEVLRASNVGLVALEVKQLVAYLLQARPGAARPPADSLLPKAALSQQLALEAILGEGAASPRRPRTACPAGARSSLREMRGMAERQEGFDRLTLYSGEPRRPYTTTGAECTRYRATTEWAGACADASRPLSASYGGSRPSTARLPAGSTGATGSAVSRPATASSSASVDSSLTAEALHGGDRGSAVVMALRAALEEVRPVGLSCSTGGTAALPAHTPGKARRSRTFLHARALLLTGGDRSDAHTRCPCNYTCPVGVVNTSVRP
jgi:hypothetical protein